MNSVGALAAFAVANTSTSFAANSTMRPPVVLKETELLHVEEHIVADWLADTPLSSLGRIVVMLPPRRAAGELATLAAALFVHLAERGTQAEVLPCDQSSEAKLAEFWAEARNNPTVLFVLICEQADFDVSRNLGSRTAFEHAYLYSQSLPNVLLLLPSPVPFALCSAVSPKRHFVMHPSFNDADSLFLDCGKSADPELDQILAGGGNAISTLFQCYGASLVATLAGLDSSHPVWRLSTPCTNAVVSSLLSNPGAAVVVRMPDTSSGQQFVQGLQSMLSLLDVPHLINIVGCDGCHHPEHGSRPTILVVSGPSRICTRSTWSVLYLDQRALRVSLSRAEMFYDLSWAAGSHPEVLLGRAPSTISMDHRVETGVVNSHVGAFCMAVKASGDHFDAVPLPQTARHVLVAHGSTCFGAVVCLGIIAQAGTVVRKRKKGAQVQVGCFDEEVTAAVSGGLPMNLFSTGTGLQVYSGPFCLQDHVAQVSDKPVIRTMETKLPIRWVERNDDCGTWAIPEGKWWDYFVNVSESSMNVNFSRCDRLVFILAGIGAQGSITLEHEKIGDNCLPILVCHQKDQSLLTKAMLSTVRCVLPASMDSACPAEVRDWVRRLLAAMVPGPLAGHWAVFLDNAVVQISRRDGDCSAFSSDESSIPLMELLDMLTANCEDCTVTGPACMHTCASGASVLPIHGCIAINLGLTAWKLAPYAASDLYWADTRFCHRVALAGGIVRPLPALVCAMLPVPAPPPQEHIQLLLVARHCSFQLPVSVPAGSTPAQRMEACLSALPALTFHGRIDPTFMAVRNSGSQLEVEIDGMFSETLAVSQCTELGVGPTDYREVVSQPVAGAVSHLPSVVLASLPMGPDVAAVCVCRESLPEDIAAVYPGALVVPPDSKNFPTELLQRPRLVILTKLAEEICTAKGPSLQSGVVNLLFEIVTQLRFYAPGPTSVMPVVTLVLHSALLQSPGEEKWHLFRSVVPFLLPGYTIQQKCCCGGGAPSTKRASCVGWSVITLVPSECESTVDDERPAKKSKTTHDALP